MGPVKTSCKRWACSNCNCGTSKMAIRSNNSKLTNAVASGNIPYVKDILGNKDMKFSRLCLYTTLLVAAQGGKKQLVQLLLNFGVCISGRSKIGSLALVAAAKGGNLDIVKLLIQKGAPVNGRDSCGQTALMTAVEKSCCSDLILYLLNDCKANVNLQNNDSKTALMLAVEQWDFETIQLLFTGCGNDNDYDCDEDIEDKKGQTALDLAKMNGSADLLNVFSDSRKKRMSPLSMAAGMNNLNLVQRLLDIYPSCIEGMPFGKTPLIAAMHGLESNQIVWTGKIRCSFELMDCLLEAGVDVNDIHSCGRTPLMFAASVGSLRAVQMLLSHGASVNISALDELSEMSDEMQPLLKRHTALMMAAQKGWASVVETLILAGSDLDMKDADGESSLGLAIKGGHKACIHALLKQWKVLTTYDIRLMRDEKVLDVLLEVKDRWDQLLEDSLVSHYVLCNAIQARLYELVKALIASGIDVNLNFKYRTHEMFYAALSDVEMLRIMLDMGVNINARLRVCDHTALMHAVLTNDVCLLDLLLEYKADMYREVSGSTALTLASLKDKPKIVLALLNRGMDVNHVTRNKQTALWCSLKAKNFALTEMLIKHGAYVNFASNGGVTVLMEALRHCAVDFSELILKNGADVNAQDVNGDTALFHALWTHSLFKGEKVSLLLQYGANINHRNLSMKTPLIVAAGLQHNLYAFKVLLASEPEVNAQDLKGCTALHVTVLYSEEEKLEMLVRSGAEMNIDDRQHRTPLMVALKTLNWTMIKALLSHGASTNIDRCFRAHGKADLDVLIVRYSLYGHHNKIMNFPEYRALLKCLKALMEAGTSLHGAEPSNLAKFVCTIIQENEFQVFKLLLQSGIVPNYLNMSQVPGGWDLIRHSYTATSFFESLLCTAILIGRPKIIMLLAQACLFHQEDVRMLQHPQITKRLRTFFQNGPNTNPSLLEELCPKNWSLQTWSKMAVQRAVGFCEGREQRVRSLPLPQGLKDELLFKNLLLVKW